MSGTINIAGTTPVDDPAYRYKMPRIQAKVEGRGNGIKTVLVNVVELGSALNRDAPEITKFFGCELGSQTSYAAETDRAIVNGSHSAVDLQSQLSKYIEAFVLCKNCRLPETYYKIKHGVISQKCNACGSVDPVDMTHKLTTFILAQHKKAKETATATEKSKEKDKKEKKEKKEKKTDEEGDSSKADKPKKEKKEKSDETSEKKKKKKSESAEEDESQVDDDEDGSDSKAADDSIERFRNFIIENADASVDVILEELRNIQTMASLRPSYRPIIFIGSVFTEDIVKSNQIETHAAVLKGLAPKEIQQRHLISAFEWFCGVRYPQLLRYFAVVLKLLYDSDIVEEDVLLRWGSDLTRTEFSADSSMISLDTLEQLKSAAKPFITWLEEAEEEDDEEGEDEEAEEA